ASRIAPFARCDLRCGQRRARRIHGELRRFREPDLLKHHERLIPRFRLISPRRREKVNDMKPIQEGAAPILSVQDYLRMEEASHEKHEFVSGRVFAMGGTSWDHNRIAFNVAAALNSHLRGGPCEVFMA